MDKFVIRNLYGSIPAMLIDLGGHACAGIIPMPIVSVFTVSAAKRIRKIRPIRGGGEAGRAGNNPLPLENTGISTSLRLVLKQMCAAKPAVCTAGSHFLCADRSCGVLRYTFLQYCSKAGNFMSALSEKTPDIIFFTEPADREQLADILQLESEVRSVLQYSTDSVNIDSSAASALVCEDFSRVTDDMCCLGSNPQNRDEIALGSAYEEEHSIGDTIAIENGGNRRIYEITGFIQSVNYQGTVCELTVDGCEALCGE